MAQKAFGAASDFYRVRLIRVDASDAPDFEWHDDILWRRPKPEQVEERELWRVEALHIETDEVAAILGVFAEPEDAHEALGATETDLAQLTKSEFEERYFPADG